MTIRKEYTKNYNVGLIKPYLIIMHWTVGTTISTINWFKNPSSKVSAHYIVDRYGEIIYMVDETDIAWHAGISSLKNYPTFGLWKSLNPCAIGIELEGRPSDIGLFCWQGEQLEAAIELCKDIKTRYPWIKITDHSSVCPEKIDVKKGTGIDIFPWEEFVESTGIEEA
jgi:N-acetylmuramoyl-L-alanine amidase